MIGYDKEALEGKLLYMCAELYGIDRITPETPMHEVRALAEAAGSMFGRALAACLHDGPITADLAMAMRRYEQQGIESFTRAASKVMGPGGELRELWNSGER